MDLQKVLEEVAKNHGITAEEVHKEMQIALNTAWEQPADTQTGESKRKEMSPDDTAPTPEQFIQYIANQIE